MQYHSLATKSLAAQIAEQIQQAIVEGNLAVDERLPTETELAKRFEVSRATIREALKRLAAKKLVRSQRGPTGGTFVNRPHFHEQQDSLLNQVNLMVTMEEFSLEEVAEARRQLELSCCPLAAERRSQAVLDLMALEIDIQSNPELSDIDFCASDVRFHRALIDASENPVMRFLLSGVLEALQPATNLIIFRFRNRQEVVAQHQAIFQALQAQDAAALHQAIDQQMSSLAEQYRQAQLWQEERRKAGSA